MQRQMARGLHGNWSNRLLFGFRNRAAEKNQNPIICHPCGFPAPALQKGWEFRFRPLNTMTIVIPSA
jgi:hypothetical protein